MNEFDFRYNNRIALGIDDIQRTNTALKGIAGSILPIGGLLASKPPEDEK